MTAKALQINIKRSIKFLFVGVIFLVVSYLTLSINTTFLVAQTDNHSKEETRIRSELGSLESEYIGITSSINKDMAYKLGFKDSLKDAVFVFRTKSITALLDRHNDF